MTEDWDAVEQEVEAIAWELGYEVQFGDASDHYQEIRRLAEWEVARRVLQLRAAMQAMRADPDGPRPTDE